MPATFESLDGDDRTKWNRAWAEMPCRRLTSPPGFGVDCDLLSGFGEPISGAISEDPPQFRDRVWRESERCPICGGSTVGVDRLAATIHPRWPNGLRVGIGVWVHPACFERCPMADEPAPIPW
jgi:hypothetical protein